VSEDGLVIVYTGKGKGKTTAALGMALRALGHGFKVVMVQFIKGEWFYGELSSSNRLEPDFELVAAGKGFVGIIDDDKPRRDHVSAAKEALRISREKISSGKYDLVILDEINYAVNLNLISADDVLDLIKNKPKHTTLVLTGNHADEKVIEIADLVTEMREIKHPYKRGRKAKRGVDF
jgi:cob(I)alamin adenosyltransferase